jgi:hyperosmotically inducible periplasmic protein
MSGEAALLRLAGARYAGAGKKGNEMKKLNRILAVVSAVALLFVAGCAGDGEKRSTGEFIDDTAIHTKVKAALVNDPIVHSSSIDVNVDRGIVSLNGAVNGEVEKRKAEEIVRGVNGVRAVENNLLVRR